MGAILFKVSLKSHVRRTDRPSNEMTEIICLVRCHGIRLLSESPERTPRCCNLLHLFGGVQFFGRVAPEFDKSIVNRV
jgi:hypothetical protein